MPYPTFSPTYQPDQGMSENHSPKTRSYKFGDGYEQTANYGINSDLADFNPKWTNEYNASGTYIINFLKERKGRPFFYQPNGIGEVLCFRCASWTAQRKRGNRFDINATFTQVADA